MKSILCFCVLSLMTAVTALAAPDLLAAYVDGSVYLQSGSAWKELSIGDSVPATATIRLDTGASLKLSGMGATISLRQKGSYDLRAVLSARQTLGSADVAAAIAGKMRLLLDGSSTDQNSVAGVRGANESKSDESGWVESGTQDAIQEAMGSIEAEKYGEAIIKLSSAEDEATAENLPELHYYLAFAYSQNGDADNANKELDDIRTPGGVSWAGDYILLKAKLELDNLAFSQELAWLSQTGNDLSGDGMRAPLYYFLLGIGYRGIGDVPSEKASFSKVIAISADSDLGKSAAQLLTNL